MKTKKTYSPSNKSKQARLNLSVLSRAAKNQREIMQAQAETEEQALSIALMTINDILLMNYSKDTGAAVFRTFKAWKDLGYTVRKKETAFRIWGCPIKAKKESTQEESEEEQAFRMFPMCCVFSNLQVEQLESDEDHTDTASIKTSTPTLH